MERELACTHLHIPAQLCTDIHRYIHTYDRQTNRQTTARTYVCPRHFAQARWRVGPQAAGIVVIAVMGEVKHTRQITRPSKTPESTPELPCAVIVSECESDRRAHKNAEQSPGGICGTCEADRKYAGVDAVLLNARQPLASPAKMNT